VVKIETSSTRSAGRLVDLDLRTGVTLELCDPTRADDIPKPLLRLPLSEIRSIEPFDGVDFRSGSNQDS
jgi:hypothetical protein